MKQPLILMARKPKSDEFDDYRDLEESSEYDEFGEDGNDEDEDEEVDFDQPNFKRGQIWDNYAEDLEYDE
jgi:hypothetical protein